MSDVVIKVESLSKQYRLGQVGTGSLRDDFKRWRYKMMGKEDPFLAVGEVNDRTVKTDADYVWALKDINFEVKQGEILGIIGKNGAGKSTLLKILSRTTSPTTGSLKMKGRVASLLEVGTGFHGELSGRENIFLNGAIMGMSKTEIRSKFDEIVDFAGVEKYIDTPVKRYSSGMYVRLAFGVAAHLEPDILIVDEVLAVGDVEFQKKAIGKMQDVSKGGNRTVIFVSHDLNAVSQLCTQGLLMKNGKISFEGKVTDMISCYLSDEEKSPVYIKKNASAEKAITIETIKINNNTGKVTSDFFYNEPVFIELQLKINDTSVRADLFVMILDGKKRRVFACESEDINSIMKLKIEPNTLVRGDYSIHAFINVPKREQIDVVEDVCHFKIIDSGSFLAKHGEYDYGVVFGKYSWL